MGTNAGAAPPKGRDSRAADPTAPAAAAPTASTPSTPAPTAARQQEAAKPDAVQQQQHRDAAVPAKRPKKKIVPKQVQISNWTAPRRPFQPIVGMTGVTMSRGQGMKGGGLRVLNIDEGDTSDLLDDTTDGSSRGSKDHGSRPGVKGGAQASPQAQPLAGPSDRAEVPPQPTPPQDVQPTMEHLREVAGMTEDEAKRSQIPLSFWTNCKHVLGQYAEWCGDGDSGVSSEALCLHEGMLISLIENAQCSKTRLVRRRLRREAAMEQLAYGQAGGAYSAPTEGVKFQEVRRQISEIEDRKKALEASINARARAMEAADRQGNAAACAKEKEKDKEKEKEGKPAATAAPDGMSAPPLPEKEWAEPEYIQDAAERLELQFLRKDLAEKQRLIERFEVERAALARTWSLYKSEDASSLNKFPVLNSRYLVLALIGKGGFSEVWKALDRTTGCMVAVKVHQLSNSWSEEHRANYIRHTRRESEIQKQLRHPHIVRLLDCFDIDGSSFATVMEYTQDEDLSNYLLRHGSMREKDAKVIIRQVLLALSYIADPARGRQIIHYDLKPANILLFGEMFVKLTDFGLSKVMAQDTPDIELTSHGAGTFWCLAPECFGSSTDDGVRISTKVDVWSAGVVFYQLLYGKKPFAGDSPGQRGGGGGGGGMDMSRQAPLEFPSQPRVSAFSQSLLKKMLCVSPTDRPSVADLLKDFAVDEEEGDHGTPEDAAAGAGGADAAAVPRPSPSRPKRKRVSKEEAEKRQQQRTE